MSMGPSSPTSQSADQDARDPTAPPKKLWLTSLGRMDCKSQTRGNCLRQTVRATQLIADQWSNAGQQPGTQFRLDQSSWDRPVATPVLRVGSSRPPAGSALRTCSTARTDWIAIDVKFAGDAIAVPGDQRHDGAAWFTPVAGGGRGHPGLYRMRGDCKHPQPKLQAGQLSCRVRTLGRC